MHSVIWPQTMNHPSTLPFHLHSSPVWGIHFSSRHSYICSCITNSYHYCQQFMLSFHLTYFNETICVQPAEVSFPSMSPSWFHHHTQREKREEMVKGDSSRQCFGCTRWLFWRQWELAKTGTKKPIWLSCESGESHLVGFVWITALCSASFSSSQLLPAQYSDYKHSAFERYDI